MKNWKITATAIALIAGTFTHAHAADEACVKMKRDTIGFVKMRIKWKKNPAHYSHWSRPFSGFDTRCMSIRHIPYGERYEVILQGEVAGKKPIAYCGWKNGGVRRTRRGDKHLFHGSGNVHPKWIRWIVKHGLWCSPHLEQLQRR